MKQFSKNFKKKIDLKANSLISAPNGLIGNTLANNNNNNNNNNNISSTI
jgi:hypothetical protein